MLSCKRLLTEIGKYYDKYKKLEAEVLAISSDSVVVLSRLARELALTFPLLSDDDARVTDMYIQERELASTKFFLDAAIVVTDRWGSVFTSKTVEKDHDLPSEAEIREWLEYIELQCEECFPPAWPL